MSSEELKPCPFCGGKAERFTLQDEENFGGDVIVCTKCDACSRIVFGEKEGLNEAWNCRAQLAAIQGGMGEDVVVLATVSMGGVEYGIGGAELGDIDIQPDMKALCALQQSLVTGEDDAYVELIDKAQHQRITAAMAAEVERLRQDIKNAFSDDLKMATMKEQEQEIIALRAECERLAEALDRQSVITGDYIARCQRLADELAITRRVIDRIGQLCTTPHESKERFIRRVQSVIEWEAKALSAEASP